MIEKQKCVLSIQPFHCILKKADDITKLVGLLLEEKLLIT